MKAPNRALRGRDGNDREWEGREGDTSTEENMEETRAHFHPLARGTLPPGPKASTTTGKTVSAPQTVHIHAPTEECTLSPLRMTWVFISPNLTWIHNVIFPGLMPRNWLAFSQRRFPFRCRTLLTSLPNNRGFDAPCFGVYWALQLIPGQERSVSSAPNEPAENRMVWFLTVPGQSLYTLSFPPLHNGPLNHLSYHN